MCQSPLPVWLQVYTKLAAVAAGGYQPFTLPDQRPFWQRLWQPQQHQQDQAWRLLDLSEVRSLYKDAQKRETLFKQHKKAKQLLESAAAAAAEREEAARQSKRFSFLPGSSSSNSAASGQGAEVSGSLSAGPPKRHLQSGSLSEFLLVGEVLKPLGETPRDLLEDSYAIITRDSRCVGCVCSWSKHYLLYWDVQQATAKVVDAPDHHSPAVRAIWHSCKA